MAGSAVQLLQNYKENVFLKTCIYVNLHCKQSGAYLVEYLESSRYLRIYIFISQCLVEPRTMFAEPWLRNTGVVTQLDTE